MNRSLKLTTNSYSEFETKLVWLVVDSTTILQFDQNQNTFVLFPWSLILDCFHGQARRQRRDHHLLTARKVSCTKALLLFDDFGETFLIIQVSGSRPNSGVSQAAWEGPDGEVMQVKVFKKQVFEEEKMFSWTQRPWPWRRKRRMGSPSSRERTISLKAAGI